MGLKEDFLNAAKSAQDRITSNLGLVGSGLQRAFASPQALGNTISENKNSLIPLATGTGALMGGAALGAPALTSASLISAPEAVNTFLPKIQQGVQSFLPKIQQQISDLNSPDYWQNPERARLLNIAKNATIGATSGPAETGTLPSPDFNITPVQKIPEITGVVESPATQKVFEKLNELPGAVKVAGLVGVGALIPQLFKWGVQGIGNIIKSFGSPSRWTAETYNALTGNPASYTDLSKYPSQLPGRQSYNDIITNIGNNPSGIGLGRLDDGTIVTADIHQQLANDPLYQNPYFKSKLETAWQNTQDAANRDMTPGVQTFMQQARPAYATIYGLASNPNLNDIANVWNSSDFWNDVNAYTSNPNKPYAKELGDLFNSNTAFTQLYNNVYNGNGDQNLLKNMTIQRADTPEMIQEKLDRQLDFVNHNFTMHQPYWDAINLTPTTGNPSVQTSGNLPVIPQGGTPQGLAGSAPAL